MIGTHDSMTFLRARWSVMEIFAWLWRTQTRDVDGQRRVGTGYLDIRVRMRKGRWQVCHGLVDMRMTFSSLREILETYRDFKVRLILERGSSLEFETVMPRLAEGYRNLSFACVKHGWKVIVNRDPEILDYTFIPWLSGLSVLNNMNRLWNMIWSKEPVSIASWARRYNPLVTEEMRNSEVVYFLDRV